MTQKEKAKRYDEITTCLKTNYKYYAKANKEYGLSDIDYGQYRFIINLIESFLSDTDKEETIYKGE